MAVESGPERRRLAGYCVALCAVAVLTTWPRLAPVLDWSAHPERHFANDAGAASSEVAVASADSYYWLRLARERLAGEMHRGLDPLRVFPEGGPLAGTPLISRGIAALADALDTSVYRAGMLWMVPLATLFIFPLGFYFWRIGAPWAGLGGALIGSLGSVYLGRTFPYRVDTDGGNLFFVWLVPLCFAAFDPRAPRGQLVAALASGAALRAFGVWYERPGFVLVYVLCLLPHLLLQRIGWRRALLWWTLVAAITGPASWVPGVTSIVSFVKFHLLRESAAPSGTAQLVFPGMLDEISEAQRAPLGTALGTLMDPPVLAVVGLIGFAALAWRHWRWLFPLAPALALGGMGLLSSQRFLMYLAPFVGVGWGFLFERAIAFAAALTRSPVAVRRASRPLGALLLIAAIPSTAFFDEPEPGVTTELLASLQALRATLPDGAVVAHSWGSGYLIQDVAGAATFNDGGQWDLRIEQLLSAAFASSVPRALQATLAFLAAHGGAGVSEALERGGYPELVRTLADDSHAGHAPIAVLFTTRMATAFSNTWRKANWSFERQDGPLGGYDFRLCWPDSGAESRLRCTKSDRPDLEIDTEAGTIGGRASVRGFVRVRSGEVVEERSWPVRGLQLQLIEAPEGPPHELHLLKSEIFESNFNQMFYLNRYDPTHFRLLIDRFPVARAWEVLPELGSTVESRSRVSIQR